MELELSIEMALVIESGKQSDLSERLARVSQLVNSVFQAKSANILAHRALAVLSKDLG